MNRTHTPKSRSSLLISYLAHFVGTHHCHQNLVDEIIDRYEQPGGSPSREIFFLDHT
jgi:hypothetical protein